MRSTLRSVRFATGLAIGLGLFSPPVALGAGAGSFSPTGSMGTPRYGAAAAPLEDGRVLVAGGFYYSGGGHDLASAEGFSPATGTFGPTASMAISRYAPAAAPLPDGRVLVLGGFNGGPVLQSAQTFNPAANAWSPTGPMVAPRRCAAAAPLPDGRVLVAGGDDGTLPYLSSAEVFNPATDTFTSTGIGSMSTPRDCPAAAPLRDGRVLIVGGYTDSSTLSSAELFDPTSNTFSSAGIGSMSTPRGEPIAAPLPDGRVLVAGGYYYNGVDHYLSSAEVFNPDTNSFSSAGIGSMGSAREGAVAAALPDGRVLVAGGRDASGNEIASAEIYAASNAFSFAVSGKSLLVSVQASGKVEVNDATVPLSASASKKRKKKRKPSFFLNPSSASGDPPTITVPLSLTKAAKSRLKKKGKVAVSARISFTPQGGLASTQTAKLKIKVKKKKKR
jgi:Kelch motif protein/galactose oxidase-like protein